MSGFTEEQMAMAKQLQASFVKEPQSSRGSASSKKSKKTTMPPPVVRPPPARRLIQTQPNSALSISNGLVRPLPSKASTSPASSSAPKPALKPAITPTKAQSTSKTVSNQAPVLPTVLAIKPSDPSVRLQPPPRPVTTIATPVQTPLKPALFDLLSLEPLEVLSIPTLVAQPVTRCATANTGACGAPLRGQQTVIATPEIKMTPETGKKTYFANDVGKVVRSYTTEAPALYELTAGELGETESSVVTVGSHGQAAQGFPKAPRPIIGLKGSRHAH